MSALAVAADGTEVGRLRWWHLADVLDVERDLFGADAWTLPMFLSELADWRGRWYVRAHPKGSPDGPTLGYAGLHAYAGEAYVNTIAVARQAQGRGLGALLLDLLIAEARRRAAVVMGLEVGAGNTRAQQLYASRGFEAVGLRRGYYATTGEDAVVMVAEIG